MLEVSLERLIGTGTTARVYFGKTPHQKDPVVVKVFTDTKQLGTTLLLLSFLFILLLLLLFHDICAQMNLLKKIFM